MKKIHSEIIEFRGSHYDYGMMQGIALKESITLHNRRGQWKSKRPRFVIDPAEAQAAFNEYAPKLWDELKGLEDSLQLPIDEVLRDFGGYRIDAPPSGCSIVTGEDFLVRNYDFHPQTYEGRFCLFQPEEGNALIGPSQRILGRMDGMNEHGLAMGYNFMHRKNPGDGFVCYMIGRIILESCATIEEAVDLVKDIPHRGSFSYVVTDKGGATKVIEATPRKVAVRDAIACTNHFEIQQHENRNYLKDSYERLSIIEQNAEDAMEAYRAYRLFNDTGRGLFSNLYKSWAGTIHTSVYLPKEREVWFALGGDQEPEVFNFGEWLAGKPVRNRSVHGQIETGIGFAHTDALFK
ncbi:acyl-CoA--6-aminopenicillanic acid acyltransferase [Planococcus plakortidis]|uniref:Acyl-CoA--6-aminopenicillanic acid acyltransferase n=1 Tax=Planococcus plakortidis TaxID=1038856 RepID=A0A1C7E4X5_9BACL|nr:C45 family peptidase [Planococcus plakortidis]ANU18870.1 acyl-CoA--6-aminopenicillanic acid acyltransferase [Planococcus plakortidis]